MIQQTPSSFENKLPIDKTISQAKVVVLNNYFRAHHSAVYREVAKRVPHLKILLSTPMEPNRNWQTDWDGLDVTVQKNWTFTATWKHKGFQDDNFIHFPIDTVKRLKAIQPDVVFSYELGVRTLLSSRYCRKHKVPLVMVGNMTDQIERERGFLRRRLRKFLKGRVDFCTYNGPACKRYLHDLGITEDRLLHFPYAYDENKVHQGAVERSHDGVLRLMFCGTLDARKGFHLFQKQLCRWLQQNPDRQIELLVCGEGKNKQFEIPKMANLSIDWKGHCNDQELSDAYRLADICVFPSLADEWGLVTVESLASGTPVLGSSYAQSVESLIQEGINGWTYLPDATEDFYSALDKALTTSQESLGKISAACRETVSHISPANSADHFARALEVALRSRTQGRRGS